MKLRRSRITLANRLRPYVDAGPPTEPMVSADLIRMFLYRWMIETGDPVEVVAKGFDMDVTEVIRLLSDDSGPISGADDRRIRMLLRLEQSDEFDLC